MWVQPEQSGRWDSPQREACSAWNAIATPWASGGSGVLIEPEVLLLKLSKAQVTCGDRSTWVFLTNNNKPLSESGWDLSDFHYSCVTVFEWILGSVVAALLHSPLNSGLQFTNYFTHSTLFLSSWWPPDSCQMDILISILQVERLRLREEK